MFEYFFTEYSHIPPGMGFGVWSVTHFIVLAVIAVCTAVICIVYRHKNTASRGLMFRILAVVCVGAEILRQLITLLTGQYNTGNIPLSMCNFSAYFLCIYAFIGNGNKNRGFCRQIGEFAYAIGLPGAFLALISPAWANLPIFNFYALYSFLMHGLVIAMSLMLIIGGDLRPDPRKLGFTVIFIAVSAPLMHIINRRLNTNFYFLETPAADSPLIFISDLVGTGWRYITGFILLVLIIWLIMYLPWVIIEYLHPHRIHRKKSPSAR
jgi:hypothetical integral membrane protein (TIGR02206 family)